MEDYVVAYLTPCGLALWAVGAIGAAVRNTAGVERWAYRPLWLLRKPVDFTLLRPALG